MNIVSINENSSLLDEVKDLWRTNSKTLGFFPEGAFLDYARKRNIVVAIDSNQKLLGYLAYRIARGRATIVHLCVELSGRGQGTARSLVEYLINTTKKLLGIGLHCRRDYVTSSFWPNVGFVALLDRPGRAANEDSELTYWWFDHGHPTLFSYFDSNHLGSKIIAVIDANVFFDFEASDDIDSEEAKGLLADWLQDSVVLSVTDELLNEINRNPQKDIRNCNRNRFYNFNKVVSDNHKFQLVCYLLKKILPKNTKHSDHSDLRQLAYAIASDAQVFVTRDDRMLKQAAVIFEQFNIHILRPSELVIRIDQLLNDTAYEPLRLGGTLLEFSRVRNGQEEELVETFLGKSERHLDFRRNLRAILSRPEKFECYTVGGDKLLCLMIYERVDNTVLKIPMFRIKKGPLSPTLATHLIDRLIMICRYEGRVLVNINDSYIADDLKIAMLEKGFYRSPEGWKKLCIAFVGSAGQCRQMLKDFGNSYPDAVDYIDNITSYISGALYTNNQSLLFEIERALWPMKITDLGIPTYIIPIHPSWASQLFDEEIAATNLFGARADLALNRENVYYRVPKPRKLIFPSRILWYVMEGEAPTGTKRIRACSYLDEVVVGNYIDVYKRFKRLGIYEWRDVCNTATRDANNEIMALRFSDTEVFANPISLELAAEVIKQEEGKGLFLQGPYQLTPSTFIKIYNFGIQSEANINDTTGCNTINKA